MFFYLAICKDPGVPQNGIRIGSSFEQGRSVTFLCNRNYTLIGSKSMVCGNGNWSSSLPQCKGKFIRIASHVLVVWLADSVYLLIHILVIEIKINRWQLDSASAPLSILYWPTADIRQMFPNEYTLFLHVMLVVANCKDPGIPRNGTRTGDNFGHGQTVSFTCNNGYTLIGSKSMVCRNGVWSSSLPQCKSKLILKE